MRTITPTAFEAYKALNPQDSKLQALTLEELYANTGSGDVDWNEIKYPRQVLLGASGWDCGMGIGYVVFDHHDDWLEKKVQLYHPDGTKHEATVVDIPFIDPARLIVRGIEKEIPAVTKLRNLKNLI